MLLAQLRPALSSAVSFVRTTEPGLLAEYAVGGLALYYLVSPVYFQNDYMVQGSECMGQAPFGGVCRRRPRPRPPGRFPHNAACSAPCRSCRP